MEGGAWPFSIGCCDGGRLGLSGCDAFGRLMPSIIPLDSVCNAELTDWLYRQEKNNNAAAMQSN